MKSSFERLMWAYCLWVVALVAGCGGVGTGGTGPAKNSVNVGVVTGIAARTVTVNGVSYDRTDAVITDGFGQTIKAEALRLGMWIEIGGVVDEAGGTKVAQSIQLRPAARGVVTAVDSGGLDGQGFTVTVLGSTAHYDTATTVIDGVDAASQIALGDVIEVHGPLGANTGTVEASRIERLSAGVQKPVELRGRVGDLDATARTLTIGRQSVRYDSAALTLRQALANGQIVRVSASAPPADGTPWTVERMTSDQPLPDNLDFVYIEGVTTDWVTGPKFKLEDVPVNAGDANGGGTVTGNGQRVAVIGSLESGTLVAKSVVRSRPGQPLMFVLRAQVTDYKSIADFRVRGVTIDARSAVMEGGVAADLRQGRPVRVTGTLSGRKLIATRVQLL
jgi:Domain of unknown function (DUF5666)